MVQPWWGGALAGLLVFASLIPAAAEEPAADRFPVRIGGKWGYIDHTGTVVIPAQFSCVSRFSEGLATVVIGGRPCRRSDALDADTVFSAGQYGYIDPQGAIAIPPQFVSVEPFHEGLALTATSGGYAFIDRTGRVAIRPGDWSFDGSFSDGLACVVRRRCYEGGPSTEWTDHGMTIIDRVCTNGSVHYGYIDRTGALAIDVTLDNGGKFCHGLTVKKEAGKAGLIDPRGAWAVEPRYDGIVGPWSEQPDSVTEQTCVFQDGLALVTLADRWGFIDTSGREVIPPTLEQAHPFSDGLAVIKTGGRCGAIDRTGRVIIKPTFPVLLEFSDGLAGVCLKDCPDGKWGYVNHDGAVVILPQFDMVEPFRGGLAEVCVVEQVPAGVDRYDYCSTASPRYIDSGGRYVWTGDDPPSTPSTASE